MKLNFLSFVAFFYATTLLASNGEVTLPSQSKTIAFTENKGQVHDQNYKPRPDVLFGAMAGNMAFHIKTTGVSYQLYRVDKYKEVEDLKTKEKRKEIDQQTIYRIDLNWVNVNKNFTTTTDKTLDGYNNYYTEGCPEGGALNVKSFSGVTLHNLYTGVNLHYYEKNGQLKYDYIVAPNANYKQIQLQIKGAQLQLQKNGSLLLKTPLGIIEEHAPIVYQNGKKLKANYVLNGKVLGFNVENYNPSQQMIIDPVVRLWGTYYGGSGNEEGYSCTTDVSGNVCIAGFTSSNIGTVIATTGAHQAACGGVNDAFLAKFNSNGVRQWGTYYGGIWNDQGFSCTTDASGNVYLAGYTESNTGTVIATAGAHQSVSDGSGDAFLVKFNASGVRQWGTYYGGSGYDYSFSCSNDVLGNVYIAGRTNSNIGTVIATTGAHQAVNGGVNDAFLVKFNSSGVRQWGTYYGGTGGDEGRSCVTDAGGNVYLTGITTSSTSSIFASAGAHQTAFGGNMDAFLVKFNSSGVRQWGTFYGGVLNDLGYSCATDNGGNIYLAGVTQSNSGTVIATNGAHQDIHAGGQDAFLVKFNGSGTRQWGTYYGGTNIESNISCNVSNSGKIALSGYTESSTGTIIATPNGFQPNSVCCSGDAFIAEFNSLGIRLWGSYYGSPSGSDYGNACKYDLNDDVFLVGTTYSGTGTAIATTSSHQSVIGGSPDAFLVKFKDCPALGTTINANTPLCQNSTLNFTTTVTSTLTLNYNWQGPNSFTANIQNPSIANAGTVNAGTYTLSVNDGQGCSETATVSVTVNLKPIVVVNSGSICSGNSFTINPSGANTYTIQGGNAVVSPNTTNSYTVVGTGTNGCVSDIATSNVTVFTTPTITVNSGAICTGNSFTINTGGANTYTIQGGNAVVSPTINTSYTIAGTSTAGCISNTFATANITVNATPTIAVNSGAICSGNSFTINPSGANTYTIQGGNAVVSPTINTTYTVAGTSTAGCVSASSATSNVTVNANPTITAISNQTLCLGNNFTLTPSGATSYTVTQGVSLPASFTSSIVITPTAGLSIYTVTGTNSLSCSGSNTLSTLVNPNPNVTAVTSATNFICIGQSATLTASGASTYTFNPGGNGSSIVVSPSVTTNYTVTGTDANSCQNTAVVTQSVDACTSIQNLASGATVNVLVYPNPSSGVFQIDVFEPAELKVFNSVCQLIYQNNVEVGSIKLDLSKFANGVYVLQVNQKNTTSNYRLIKND